MPSHLPKSHGMTDTQKPKRSLLFRAEWAEYHVALSDSARLASSVVGGVAGPSAGTAGMLASMMGVASRGREINRSAGLVGLDGVDLGNIL